MHRRLRRAISAGFSVPEEFNRQYNHTKQKDKKADPVNAVHIPDPFIFRAVGVFLPQVEVFGYLSEDSHESHLFSITTSGQKSCSPFLYNKVFIVHVDQHITGRYPEKIAEQIQFRECPAGNDQLQCLK